MIEIFLDQSTHEQLLNRVRSLARELAEAKAALAANEARDNEPAMIAARNLIERIRAGL